MFEFRKAMEDSMSVIPPKNSAIDKYRESVKLEADGGELSMRKSRYAASQIIRILKEVEGSRAV
jgi:hypothetical protein